MDTIAGVFVLDLKRIVLIIARGCKEFLGLVRVILEFESVIVSVISEVVSVSIRETVRNVSVKDRIVFSASEDVYYVILIDGQGQSLTYVYVVCPFRTGSAGVDGQEIC